MRLKVTHYIRFGGILVSVEGLMVHLIAIISAFAFTLLIDHIGLREHDNFLLFLIMLVWFLAETPNIIEFDGGDQG